MACNSLRLERSLVETDALFDPVIKSFGLLANIRILLRNLLSVLLIKVPSIAQAMARY